MLIPVFLAWSFALIVPGLLIWALWRRLETAFIPWLLKAAYTGGFVLYAFLVGRWDWVGYWLRYVVVVLFVLAAIASYRGASRGSSFAQWRGTRWRANAGAFAVVIVVGALLAWTIDGYSYRGTPVRLAYPLRDGWFYVGQGGSTTIVNYHNSVAPQAYAVDIVALDRFGVRASGFYPQALDRYVIYGKPVYSPCSGTVTAAVDGLPDQIPPAADRQHRAGNHVVIACQDANVLLAHLRPRSVLVEPEQTVAEGQRIGAVGNSGNTTEPHLHVHAVRGAEDPMTGDAVPMLFDGTFPVRNSTF